MISDVHYIELWINKQLIELESQESLNLRINNVLFDPTKTSTTQAEYSYSFDIPSTPNNDMILGYANNLSKMNKFHARYPAEVYADGTLIFDGSLTIQKYSAKEKSYSCNLVSIKINTLEEIFGEAVMTDINNWNVPFSGAPTINSVNDDPTTNYFFPLVSYGVFQKEFVTKDEVAATYTPKHNLDKYNKWWIESFYPSLNVVETLRKAFEWKGYTVGGSAFSDPLINWIYASTNLAQEQTPEYNLGNPKFGYLGLNITWNNRYSMNTNSNSGFGSGRIGTNLANSTGGLSQDLKFPYQRVRPAVNAVNGDASEEFNFSTIQFWNMCDSVNNPSGVTVNIEADSYMYDPNEMVVVIPADGWYKIKLTANASLSAVGSTFTAQQWYTDYYQGHEFKKVDMSITRGLKEHTPLEIQLIRNYNENIELIKGTKNIEYATGNPNESTYTYQGGSYTSGTYTNKTEWNTDFPHQDLYASKAPTKTEGLNVTVPSSRKGGFSGNGTSGSGTFGGGRTTRGGSSNDYVGAASSNVYGFMHRNGYVMPYDQVVSQAFICGFSSLGDGTVSVMRNDSSWSKTSTVNNKIFADVRGMDLIEKGTGDATTTTPTEYCKNEYRNSTASFNGSNSSFTGRVECCVYLQKNDILELVAIQRDYDGQKYCTAAQCNLQITAMNNESYAKLLADPYWGVNSDTTFPTLLNLFNFTNKETKVSDWISNIQKAFNLELVMDGNHVDINTNQGINKNITYAIDIDDRVSSDEAESEYISYPKEMSVMYKIDTDEWGFELTVPQEYINSEDWKEHGDSGYTVIQLNDDTYETSTQNTSTNFSYTYYDNFLYKFVNEDGTESSGNSIGITIPVIEKAEYMAEGYGYDEAMKHDGYSFTQRFWYRDQPSQEYVWLSSILASGRKECVYLTYPVNSWNGFNLSYKDTEKSIATEYFNIHPMLSSNYVNVDVYLTPEEYKDIKGGALVHFDSDLYYCSEINGYDPSGANRTTLKLIKKV